MSDDAYTPKDIENLRRSVNDVRNHPPTPRTVRRLLATLDAALSREATLRDMVADRQASLGAAIEGRRECIVQLDREAAARKEAEGRLARVNDDANAAICFLRDILRWCHPQSGQERDEAQAWLDEWEHREGTLTTPQEQTPETPDRCNHGKWADMCVRRRGHSGDHINYLGEPWATPTPEVDRG